MDQELSSGIKVLLVIVTILFPIVGIIFGILWMTGNDNSEEKKRFGKTLLILSIVLTVLTCICSILGFGLLSFAAY